MAIVELRDLKKNYINGKVKVEALKGINLKIEKGEFTVLAGPSGSGKTTLLNIIGAMDSASNGTVTVSGQDISRLSKKEASDFRRENIGFIFQNYNLIPVLTVYENIVFALDLMKKHDKKLKKNLVEQIMEDLGISELRNRKPSEISGGQQQRVAIARALVKNPDIVLADEPTANLDTLTGEGIVDLMKKLNEEKGITFIFSSHDYMIIDRAERVVRLRDGMLEE